MITEVDRAAGEFRKQAETVDEAARLAREAQVLAVARHPGVVELLRADSTALTLRLVDGEPLSEQAVFPANEMVGIAVTAATTLADLHDLGVAHGALSTDHMLVDRSGQPVMCGFGRGAINARPDGEDATADVVALARALLELPTVDGASTTPILTAAARNPPEARELATLLAGPSYRPHRFRRLHGPHRPHRLPTSIAIGVPVAFAASTVIALIALFPANTVRGQSCPGADRRCGPIPRPDGMVQTPFGRFRVGGPDDVVVVGRWRCGAALPALLRPAMGEVWVWDSWPGAGGPTSARLVGRIADALSLRVDPGRAGCDGLRVMLRDGAAINIHPRRPT